MGALSGFFDAQTSALNTVKTATQDRVRKNAGARLQQRDYGGAANELYGAGMLDEGSDAQNFGDAQQDRTKTAEAAKVKERASVLTQVARGLKEVPAGQRKAQLDRIAPIFGKVGLDTAMLADLTEDQLDDASLDAFAGEVERNLQFFEGNDGIYSANKATGEVKRAHAIPPKKEPRWVERTLPDGSTEWFDINAAAGGAIPTSAPAGGGGFEGQIGGLLKREGGYNDSDGHSGAPVNFGINQKANPDIDVRNLTPERAAQIYKERYWNAVGADQLPPEAQGAVFDAAVNQGVGAAKEMWAKSGGDVSKFNQLRLQRYRQTPGYDKYGKVWEQRVAETAGGTLMGDAGGDQLTSPAGSPGTVRGSAPKPDANPPPETGLKPMGNGYFRNALGQIFYPNKDGKPAFVGGPDTTQVEKTVGTIQGLNSVLSAINEFDRTSKALSTKDFGPLGRYTGDPKKYASAKAAATDLMMLLKGPEVYNLGVITGPDMTILEGVVQDPAKFNTMILKGQIAPQLRQLSISVGNKYSATKAGFKVLGGNPDALQPIYKSPDGKYGAGRPKPTAAGKPSGLPQAAVRDLASDPSPARRQQFDEVFGKGAAARALGGR